MRPALSAAEAAPLSRLTPAAKPPGSRARSYTSVWFPLVFVPKLLQRGENKCCNRFVLQTNNVNPRKFCNPPVHPVLSLLIFKCTRWYMTLGRCPLSIVCSRGTPSRALSLSRRRSARAPRQVRKLTMVLDCQLLACLTTHSRLEKRVFISQPYL